MLLAVFAVFVLALELAGASDHRDRDALIEGLDLGHGAGLLTVLAVVCAIAVVVRRFVTARVLAQRLQKVRADRPRLADLLCDDAGRGSFTDVQYMFVSAAAVVFAAVRLTRRPDQLPDLPWGARGAGRGLGGDVLRRASTRRAAGPSSCPSYVPREAGDLDAPDPDRRRHRDPGCRLRASRRGAARQAGAHGGQDRLGPCARATGAGARRLRQPVGHLLTVPVPVDVEPGPVEVQVVTAGGVETNRYPIDVLD